MTLFVHAHPSEAEGLAGALPRVACIGTGKVAAASSLSRILARERTELVVAFGVAGVYPGSDLAVGDLCLVAQDCLADEGVLDETGFRDLAAMDLGTNGPWHADPLLVPELAALLQIPVVAAATVSTCSATDRAAVELAERTGAAIETMEGAAIAAACDHAGVGWIQLRAVSNRTGDRSAAGWELAKALHALHEAVRSIAVALDR